METLKKQFFASEVSFSESQQSEIYQSITLRMFEAPGANLNGCAVTESFIDEIVTNADKYVCIPLCADVERIKRGDWDNLGHMYDARTGEFKSQIIGAFHSFKKEITEDGCALIGEARVMKRNPEICEALATLFERGELNFSFEVTAGEYTQDEFGTIIIDASERNFLEGMAVVTNPAYVNAKALQLVAEAEEGKGSNMEQEHITAGEIDINEIIKPEDEAAPAEETPIEEAPTDEINQETDVEVVETTEVPVEEPAPIVEEAHVEEPAAQVEEAAACPCDDEEKKDEEELEEDAACKKKKAEIGEEIVAQLQADIEKLREEIASLKSELTEKKVEVAETISAVNPFVSEITTQGKYSLLESCKYEGKTYSLLDPAN